MIKPMNYLKPSVIGLLLLLILPGLVAAQSLRDLLPADTFVALGMQDIQSHTDKLEPYLLEIERLDLLAALSAVFGDTDLDLGEELESLPMDERLRAMDPLELLGQEAWVAVSLNRFNPLPTVSLLSEVSSPTNDLFSELLSELGNQDEVNILTEGAFQFYVVPLPEDEDLPIPAVAVSQQGNTLLFSTNPDTMRAMLRQLAGSSEANLSRSENFGTSLGELGAANFYAYIDFGQIAATLTPLARGFGFDRLVQRLSDALATFGVSSGVLRITDTGFQSESRQLLVNKDTELYDLLLSGQAASKDAQRFFPTGALAFSSASSNLAAGWDYLNNLAKSTPELGGDLDMLLQTFLGINLRDLLFSWTDQEFITVTSSVSEVPQPGISSDNLLGESVFIVQASDEAKARSGMQDLLQNLSRQVASFTDPSGGAGSLQQAEVTMADVDVTTYDIAQGLSLSFTVADGYAFFATSEAAMEAVLSARLLNERPLESLLKEVPADALSYSYTDNQASMRSTATQLKTQLQLMAGLGGAATLDFDAVEAAGDALEAFVLFIAERLGSSFSYSQQQGRGFYGYGESVVSW